MKVSALLLATCLLFTPVPQQTAKNYSALTTTQLIDELTTIDSPGAGYHPTAWVSAFVAEDALSKFDGGVLGSQAPTIHLAFKELVKRGITSLPDLIKALTDKRETKLKVGDNFFSFQYFSDEYELKQRKKMSVKESYALLKAQLKTQFEKDVEKMKENSFSGQYTLKVGDICYAAIGQIVNRSLNPVRYQPSAILVVNSPIAAPELVTKVVADWGNATADTLKLSLMSDVEVASSPFWAVPAIKRLRYYFPNEYQKLRKSKLGKKIRQAEIEEAKEK
ncbi:MAG: hypothetical protein JNK38_22635 [Acidobacteria bacterium]|nr:hypothetical protein [Acidobacteriota bacterium]